MEVSLNAKYYKNEEKKMLKGQILSCVSNLYQVQIEDKIIECNARGKFKQSEISPVVGDYVEIEKLEKEEGKGVICEILPRTMYSKRPKLSNLTQIILVVSLKSPKPDFLLLDKQLVYAEFLKIKPVICINKIDLGKKDTIYEKIGYKVIDTNAKENIGIENLKKFLQGEITAFSGNSGVRKININK